MKTEEYMRLSKRTMADPSYLVKRYTEKIANLNHAAQGLVTESGEFTDALKKHMSYGASLDEVNLLEEIGDILWYISLALDTLGYTFDDAMMSNINKLSLRYPGTFDSYFASNRNLEKERESLENDIKQTVDGLGKVELISGSTKEMNT